MPRAHQLCKGRTQHLHATRPATLRHLIWLLSQLTSRPPLGSDGRSFYRLFKHMDIDSSGRISFAEVVRMVRDELKLSSSEMPRHKIQGLWR